MLSWAAVGALVAMCVIGCLLKIQSGKGIVDLVGAKCVPRDSLLTVLHALDLISIEWH